MPRNHQKIEEIMVAENIAGSRFTVLFKADVILHMHSLVLDTHSHTLFWKLSQFVFIIQPYMLLSE